MDRNLSRTDFDTEREGAWENQAKPSIQTSQNPKWKATAIFEINDLGSPL
jgi:hypothetical protein